MNNIVNGTFFRFPPCLSLSSSKFWLLIHFFPNRIHDFDNNSMLDGLEILQAISHILPMTEVDDDESVDLTDKNPEDSTAQNKMSLAYSSPSSGTGIPAENQKLRLDAEVKKASLLKQREEDFHYYIGNCKHERTLKFPWTF